MRPSGRGPKRPQIERYEAMAAANDIARAREHMQNPRMMAAIRKHVNALNSAVTGGLKPKRLRTSR